MEASLHGHDTVVQILLTYAPDGAAAALAQADADGNTALHFASSNGNLLVLRTLLAAGADAGRMNAWSWTAEAYSATVQAEVYLKTLVGEVERKKQARREGDAAKPRTGPPGGSGWSGRTLAIEVCLLAFSTPTPRYEQRKRYPESIFPGTPIQRAQPWPFRAEHRINKNKRQSSSLAYFSGTCCADVFMTKCCRASQRPRCARRRTADRIL
jgi:hypothetical protein